MSLRKVLLLLAVIVLTGTVASAQVGPAFQCVANAGVPPLIRAEGLAELVGDLVLNCTGGTPTASGVPVPKVNVRVFLNTNVTSHLMSGTWSEAVLAIDDPVPGEQNVCGPTDSGIWNPALQTCDLVGDGNGVNYATGVTDSVPNIYQGRYIAPNQIEWLGVPIDPPGTTATRIIRITNVRVNANQLGVSGSLIPSQVVMFVSMTGATSVPINNPQQIVAYVTPGLSFRVEGARNFLQCEGEGSDASCPGDVQAVFSENFSTAFKVKEDDANAGNQDGFTGQPVFGFIYNTESGWYNPASAIQNDLRDTVSGVVGLASQGTRLRLYFTNVPSGASIYVYSPSCGGLTATLVSPSGSGRVQVPISGGSGEAIFEVTQHSPFTNDIVQIGIDVVFSAGAALGTASVAGSYAPISSVTTATTSDLQPRFVDTGSPQTLFSIVSCSTSLLFPFVTNQAGFDTGLVIANTSRDPFGTPTQQGTCTLYYYGFTTGGGPAPAPVTTPNIPAGNHAIWTLSSGGTVQTSGGSIPAAPGFQGYIIAQCNFQYAHGYAFISDLGAQKLAQGYLALVMSQPLTGSRDGVKSEVLGN